MALHQTDISAPSIHEISFEGYRAAALTKGAWYMVLGSMQCAVQPVFLATMQGLGKRMQDARTVYTLHA